MKTLASTRMRRGEPHCLMLRRHHSPLFQFSDLRLCPLLSVPSSAGGTYGRCSPEGEGRNARGVLGLLQGASRVLFPSPLSFSPHAKLFLSSGGSSLSFPTLRQPNRRQDATRVLPFPLLCKSIFRHPSRLRSFLPHLLSRTLGALLTLRHYQRDVDSELPDSAFRY